MFAAYSANQPTMVATRLFQRYLVSQGWVTHPVTVVVLFPEVNGANLEDHRLLVVAVVVAAVHPVPMMEDRCLEQALEPDYPTVAAMEAAPYPQMTLA